MGKYKIYCFNLSDKIKKLFLFYGINNCCLLFSRNSLKIICKTVLKTDTGEQI